MSIDRAQLPLLPSARKKRLLKDELIDESQNEQEKAPSPAPKEESQPQLPHQDQECPDLKDDSTDLERSDVIARIKEKEKERDLLLEQFSSLPPLPTTTTTMNLMHYISTTTRFINTFAASTNETCIRSSNAIDDLEVKMSLLESKINSMEIISEDNDLGNGKKIF